MSGRIPALAIALALAFAAATCGDDEDPPDCTTSSTEPGTSSTTPSPEDEVEAAYLAYWDMAVRLAQAPNPDDPEIGERASGLARGNLIDGLTTLRTANQRTEPGERYGHGVLSIQVDQAGGTAVLEDCAVDESRLVDVATGELVTEGTTTTHWRVHLVHDGTRWLVDEFEQIDAWSGVVECQ
jgi:hypothetical protein